MRVELLAPAGTYGCVKAAVNAGADAVYAGGEFFGARAYADNLDTEEMCRAIDYAHIHGKKLYLTVNTLFKDSELDKLYDFILPFYREGLDAAIVQDPGALKLIRECFPDMNIHASTQMTVTGVNTALMLKDMGVGRIVVPRELSLDEINDIYKSTGMEIESFIHGALCYCYSGQCLLSSFIGGRSGNRGRCAQPCRMPYDAFKESGRLNREDERYLLSPKDMCTLDILPQIISAGVFSLKIEGRMKKPEYVAGAVSIYRKYIDRYLQYGDENYTVDSEDTDALMKLFNRNGFNSGYYNAHNGRDMMSLIEPKFRAEDEKLTEQLRHDYINNDIKEIVNLKLIIRKHLPAIMYADMGGISVKAVGEIPSEAKSRPLDTDTAIRQMKKTGGSQFAAGDVEADIDDGLFMTVGALNELRRNALDMLEDKICGKYRRDIKTERAPCRESADCINDNGSSCTVEINCLVNSMEQFRAVVADSRVHTVYVGWRILERYNVKDVAALIHDGGKEFYIALPHVCRKSAAAFFEKNAWIFDCGADGYLVRNIEEYFYVKELSGGIVFDYNVYSFNRRTEKLLSDICVSDNVSRHYTTAPLELNYTELKERGCKDSELVAYGFVPAMISAGCVKKTAGTCNHISEDIHLKDRTGSEFLCRSECKLCYNIIYNSRPISLLDKYEEVCKLGARSLRLEFTDEDERQTADITDRFAKRYIECVPQNELSYFTRGHFTRGVK